MIFRSTHWIRRFFHNSHENQQNEVDQDVIFCNWFPQTE